MKHFGRLTALIFLVSTLIDKGNAILNKGVYGCRWQTERYYAIFLVFIFAALPLFAQFSQGLTLGADYHYGAFLHHSKKQTFDVPNPSMALSIELLRQTNGSRYWHKAHHFPRFGVGAMYKSYGNDSLLGQGFAIYPQLDVFHVRTKHFRLMTRLAFGFAYLNRPYDRFTNAGNTAIGSRFNNYTMLGFAAEYDIVPNLLIRIGGNVSHSSNGHFRSPNLGLNTAGIQVGLHYRFAPNNVLDTLNLSYYAVSKKVRFGIRYGFAQKEGNLPDGPFYNIHVFSPYFIFPRSAKRVWLAGAEISTNGESIAWKKDNEHPDPYPFAKTTYISVFGGQEVLWGKVGFMGQFHLYMNPPFKDKNFFFTRIGPTYHFQNPQRHPHFNAYIGLFLKAHYASADYAEGTLGINF